MTRNCRPRRRIEAETNMRTAGSAGTSIARAVFGLTVLLIVMAAIFSRPPKRLSDFDQPVYLTIAYDIERYGVFSNGVFDAIDSTVATPTSGMSFGPLYPWMVLSIMRVDARFDEAVRCAVESNRGHRDVTSCETYAAPIHLAHAFFLTIAILAIAYAAEIIFAEARMFWLAGSLATLALLPEADLFSFAMTESATLFLYSMLALVMVLFYTTGLSRFAAAGGFLLGLLTLTRAEYAVLFPALLGLLLWRRRRSVQPTRWGRHSLVFVAAFLMALGPWMFRNAISIGKVGITEEYGSASVIERFAFDDMTAKEFALAGLYCVGTIGPPVVDSVFGEEAMHRFHYDEDGSFFAVGRSHRNELMATYAKLDPIIWVVAREELAQNWWRYLVVMIPLAWCGMWVGSPPTLLIIPLFVLGALRAIRASNSLFVEYSIPAFVMLALHAAVSNHYTRYNLILIGPYAVGAGYMVLWWTRRFLRSRTPDQRLSQEISGLQSP
jgi:hypothetical protein